MMSETVSDMSKWILLFYQLGPSKFSLIYQVVRDEDFFVFSMKNDRRTDRPHVFTAFLVVFFLDLPF